MPFLQLLTNVVRTIKRQFVPPQPERPPSIHDLCKRLIKRLKTGSSVLETEKWFMRELVRLITLEINGRSGEDELIEQQRLMLKQPFKNPKDAVRVHAGFLSLRSAYVVRKEILAALKMARYAAFFKPLSRRERQRCLEEAAEHPLGGYWLSEAALDFGRGTPSRASERILAGAAANGNELSQFILKCFRR